MKKNILIAVLAFVFLACSVVSFAEEAEEAKDHMMHKEMKGKEMRMHHKSGMMKKMMQREIIATEDGGVAVLAGNKLIKYDKKLNLVNEVKIDTGMKEMCRKMMQKKGKCPTCGSKIEEKPAEE